MIGRTDDDLFVMVIVFWLTLIILTNIFSDYLFNANLVANGEIGCLKSGTECNPYMVQQDGQSITSVITNIFNRLFGTLNALPGLQYLVPIFKLLTFQYSPLIHPVIALILDIFMIVTFYIVANYFKGLIGGV